MLKSKSPLNAFMMLFIGMSCAFVSCAPNDKKVTEDVRSGISTLYPGIEVAVKDGVVTLSGEVAEEATKTSAENSVRDIKGVKSVVNNITVRKLVEETPQVMISPDDALRKSIDSAFSEKKIAGVNATIENGVVTLTGTVKRADLVKVMQAANEARPKKVVNQLTIK